MPRPHRSHTLPPLMPWSELFPFPLPRWSPDDAEKHRLARSMGASQVLYEVWQIHGFHRDLLEGWRRGDAEAAGEAAGGEAGEVVQQVEEVEKVEGVEGVEGVKEVEQVQVEQGKESAYADYYGRLFCHASTTDTHTETDTGTARSSTSSSQTTLARTAAPAQVPKFATTPFATAAPPSNEVTQMLHTPSTTSLSVLTVTDANSGIGTISDGMGGMDGADAGGRLKRSGAVRHYSRPFAERGTGTGAVAGAGAGVGAGGPGDVARKTGKTGKTEGTQVKKKRNLFRKLRDGLRS
ncbi:hypothetical protein EDC01DRAFT_775941 [Geopyxis carbonaria]|nr:hypothetical protein EDC01DRAFT_775941 [Geopyxis carbonaria]